MRKITLSYNGGLPIQSTQYAIQVKHDCGYCTASRPYNTKRYARREMAMFKAAFPHKEVRIVKRKVVEFQWEVVE